MGTIGDRQLAAYAGTGTIGDRIRASLATSAVSGTGYTVGAGYDEVAEAATGTAGSANHYGCSIAMKGTPT